MLAGHFYFIKDQYFIDFPDPYLMKNKDPIGGKLHDRACFFAFQECGNKILWLIPISSQFSKYQPIYQSKIKKYGRCDTIVFGFVLGKCKAFLIQNMCPVTTEYIENEYIDSVAQMPVMVDGKLERELIVKASRVLRLVRQGVKLVFPDILEIESRLLDKKS